VSLSLVESEADTAVDDNQDETNDMEGEEEAQAGDVDGDGDDDGDEERGNSTREGTSISTAAAAAATATATVVSGDSFDYLTSMYIGSFTTDSVSKLEREYTERVMDSYLAPPTHQATHSVFIHLYVHFAVAAFTLTQRLLLCLTWSWENRLVTRDACLETLFFPDSVLYPSDT
jgi:hypothetical protein